MYKVGVDTLRLGTKWNIFLFFAQQSCTINPLQDSLVLGLLHEFKAVLRLEYLPRKFMVLWELVYLQE